MGRLIMLLLIVASVGAALWALAAAMKPQPTADRVLTDEDVLASARQNYADLVESQRVLGAILEDDEDLPTLKERRRREAKAIVSKYTLRNGKEPQC